MPRNWRVPSTPESEAIWRKGFENVSSYSTHSKFNTPTIDSNHIQDLFVAIQYPHNRLQLQIYKHYWDVYFGGLVREDVIHNIFNTLYDSSKFAQTLAKAFDMNEDGVISQEEFNEVMLVLWAHDPRLMFIDYKSFVQEADENGDGKVSVDELGHWIKRHLDSTPD